MNLYKLNCSRGYSVLNEAPPKIDSEAIYIVQEKSSYYAHCVIVKRLDGKKYFGNDTWIVPESALILVSD